MSIFALLRGKHESTKLSYDEVRKAFPVREKDLEKLVPRGEDGSWTVEALRGYFDEDAIKAKVTSYVDKQKPAERPAGPTIKLCREQRFP